ncbi:MAG: alpha/beta hydrolase family protein, partial [Kiritimatiellales bacterium]
CGLYDVVNLGTSRFGRSEKFLLNNDPALLKKASAIYNIRENPPKALLIHGKSDATIDYMQAIRFAEELRRHGGSVQTLILEGTGHDFGYPDAVDKAINGFLHSLGFLVAP